MSSTVINSPVIWTTINETLKFSPATINNINNNNNNTNNNGMKQLWKMIIVDNNRKTTDKNKKNEYLNECSPRKVNSSNNMSLLKFLAINALELTAPASPSLLQQNHVIPPGWLQLSGHPKSIAPAAYGVVRKRISSITDSEAIAYRGISIDEYASKLVPEFLGVSEQNDECYLELQDLLHGFVDPAVMDIKLGCRTFLESEVTNTKLRSDLYEKMMAVDDTAPTAEEHELKAITKLRYMIFRERMSSSHTKGFRIEALKMAGANAPITNLKTVRNDSDILETMTQFLAQGRRSIVKKLLKRLREMRSLIERSAFFQVHEIVGSSIFIVYENDKCGAWLIDFAKTRRLPEDITVDHRKAWQQGNCEEGLLHGIDQLIIVFEKIHRQQVKKCDSRKLC